MSAEMTAIATAAADAGMSVEEFFLTFVDTAIEQHDNNSITEPAEGERVCRIMSRVEGNAVVVVDEQRHELFRLQLVLPA